MAINSYADLGTYMNTTLAAKGVTRVPFSPHGPMWDELSYVEFTEGNVPGVEDPVSGDPMPILVIGDAAISNFILALQGTAGTPFGPGGQFGQMPAGGPFFTPSEIQPIIDWINAGCPQ